MRSIRLCPVCGLALAALFLIASSGAAQSFNFTTIDFPCCTKGIAPRTVLGGINPAGDIVGEYRNDVGKPHKAFLYRRGKFSAVMSPCHPGAIPDRITPDVTMYGCLHDFDTMDSKLSAFRSRFGDSRLRAGGGELPDPTESWPKPMHGGGTPDGKVMVGFCADVDQDGGSGHGPY